MKEQSLRRTLWLAWTVAVPIAMGLLIFVWYDAPSHYVWMNGGAVVLGLLAIHFVRLPKSERSRRIIAFVLLALLALPLLSGPEIDGARRWLSLGPVTLNTGLLVAPILGVIAMRDASHGYLYLTAGALIAALQPDAAMSLAFTLTLLFLYLIGFQRRALIPALACAAATWWAFTRGGPPPVPFVEDLLPMLWFEFERPAVAFILGAMLIRVPFEFFNERAILRQDAVVLSSILLSYFALSFAAPYPVPLAGYGAASILGFMVALSFSPRPGEGLASDLLTSAHLVNRWEWFRGRKAETGKNAEE